MTFGTRGLAPIASQHNAVLNLVLSLSEHLEELVYAEHAPFFLLGRKLPSIGNLDAFLAFRCMLNRTPVPEPVFLVLCQFEVGLEYGESSF